jgi:N6-L-threonylcarbamoyladenine synthase
MKKFKLAAEQQNIRVLALAGGVSANSGLRKALLELENEGYQIFIPPFEYCTDNAAMIAITGWLNLTSCLWKSTESRITARLPLDQP